MGMLRWFLCFALVWRLCATSSAQEPPFRVSEEAPAGIISDFQARFQGRFDRWGGVDHKGMQVILDNLEVTLQHYPNDWRLQWWKAGALRELGRFSEAEEMFRNLSKRPDLPISEAASTFLGVTLWQDGNYLQAWRLLKEKWFSTVSMMTAPAWLLTIYAILTTILFLRRGIPRRFIAVILLWALAYLLVAVVKMLLSLTIQGSPLPLPDYPRGGWVTLLSNIVLWLTLTIIAHILGREPLLTKTHTRSIASFYYFLLSVVLLVALTWDSSVRLQTSLSMERLSVACEQFTYPFLINALFALTLGVYAQARFYVLTLYTLARQAFLNVSEREGIGFALLWCTAGILLSQGLLPMSLTAWKMAVLGRGWAIAAILMWEAVPRRFFAYLPFAIATLMTVASSLVVSLGHVIR